jgi:hypothetical protein
MSEPRMMRRVGCVLAVAISVAAHAGAQTEDDRPTLELGPVQFRPALMFKDVGIDNNVFNEPTNPKRDFTSTFTPALEVSTHPGRARLTYTTATDFVYFQKYTAERSRNTSMGGRAEMDLSWLKPFASFSAAVTSARPNSEIDARVRHEPRTYTAGTTVKIASRTSIGILGRRTTETYDENAFFRGQDLARALNTTMRAYESSVNFELTPFTTFSIVGGKEEQRFEHAPERDADSIRIAPTLTFSPLGLITGSASFGYRRFNGLDPSFPDYSGFVSSGSVGVLFYDRYKVDTTFTRDARYSYERTLPYYIVSGVRAALSAQTVGPIDLRLLGGHEALSYRALAGGTVPARDRVLVYGGGVGYRIATRARFAVDAEFSHRLSERDESREFRNHRLVALLTWGVVNR